MDQAADDGRQQAHIHLSATDQKKLLQMARDAISTALLPAHNPKSISLSTPLAQIAGVFVTLRCRTAEELLLRGCIGQVKAETPLYKTVPQLAVKAATTDPRFPALTAAELPTIHISISILSTLLKITTLDSIEIGKHGLFIEGYGRHGLLLPEVPLTRNWGKHEFLQALCRKAGLATDAWRSNRVKIFAFTTLEFEEPKQILRK
jgi:AmmeMemoRadiSam system protein A